MKYKPKRWFFGHFTHFVIGKATIRIAWGLSTEDFKRVSGFVIGILFHPAIGKKELKHIGWSFGVKNMEAHAMRKSLEDAEKDALSQS